ncbi:S24/S26 family peptidase [Cohnella luojiensis]|uniref:S24/S26 family peptidase n=1 Tax=Cohnella luojiensis TaxID=652876 RepID=UPI001430AF4B|nr:S24/S26 family peptidase [Cohnella luojiensis]
MREENIRTFGALMERKGEVRLAASGYSMYPYIKPDDECRFVSLTGSLRIGQIGLVASHIGILYSHRLHRVKRSHKGARYFFRGDANRFYDPPVKSEQIIGVLMDLKRKGKVMPENRKTRRLWSYFASRFPLFMLPFVVLGKLKKRALHQSTTGKRRA